MCRTLRGRTHDRTRPYAVHQSFPLRYSGHPHMTHIPAGRASPFRQPGEQLRTRSPMKPGNCWCSCFAGSTLVRSALGFLLMASCGGFRPTTDGSMKPAARWSFGGLTPKGPLRKQLLVPCSIIPPRTIGSPRWMAVTVIHDRMHKSVKRTKQ